MSSRTVSLRLATGGIAATRRLVVQIAVVMAAGGLLLIATILLSARAMDASAVAAQAELLDNAVTARTSRALSELRSVAWWDEAVVRSRATPPDTRWLDMEIGAFVTGSFHHDRIMILDERDRPIYGFARGGHTPPEKMRADFNTIAPLVAQARGGPSASPRVADSNATSDRYEDSRFTNRRYGRSAAAVVDVGGTGELATVMAITPSVDMRLAGARPRLMVSFIRLDAAWWRQAGRDALIPDLGLARADDARLGKMSVRSDSGAALGELRWTPRRPGQALIENILPFVLTGLAVAAVAIGALARRLLGTSQALTAREAAAQYLANHDPLTGLPNRRKFEGEFAARADGDAGSRLAVACLDLDRFKDINDTLGHNAGDQLIQRVAERLQQTLAPGDFVARLGGDEFAVLGNCATAFDADDLTARVARCFHEPLPVSGHLVETSASIGLAFGPAERSFEALMREADIALYEAKARGRACCVRFEGEMAHKIERRHALEVDLRRAIANRELSLLYQPIVAAATGHIASVEALLRWTSPRHGAVPPDVFVPIAEEAGLMADIGRFVIDRAVGDAKRWPNLETAINISPAQLRSATILRDLIEPTERHGVSPARITIEITESVLMTRDERTLRTLNILKERGFGLALDDFGTGYSSLAYIRDFPFDKLKIDRSFVAALDTSDRAQAIVEAVANFGRILGREIVAEGVETEVEMQAMQRAGCTHLQGFLFARPMPAAHIEAMAASLGRLAAGAAPDNLAVRSILRRA